MTAWLEDPDLLWRSTRLGREEYMQKLLATLILGEEAKGWNRRRPPSSRGAEFIRRLYADSFDDPPDRPLEFVDEFELPKRHDAEPSGWPDFGIAWPDRLFLVELKTERSSHREGQLQYYMELAVHHYGDDPVRLLYLTPEMPAMRPLTEDPHRAAHTSWRATGTLIDDCWSGSDIAWERVVTAQLLRWIGDVEEGRPPPPREAPPATRTVTHEDALRIAAQVQTTGDQRALEHATTSPEELEQFRLELRDAVMHGPEVDGVRVTHVLPWIWNAETSGGQPLTTIGAETGYELRLSRYREAVAEPTHHWP